MTLQIEIRLRSLSKRPGDHSGLADPSGGAFRAETFLLLEEEGSSTRVGQGESHPPLLENMRKVAAASQTKTGPWLTASTEMGALAVRPTENQVQPITWWAGSRFSPRASRKECNPVNTFISAYDLLSPQKENISLIRFCYEKCLNENMTAINSIHLHNTKRLAELLIICKALTQDWAPLRLRLFVCTCTPEPSNTPNLRNMPTPSKPERALCTLISTSKTRHPRCSRQEDLPRADGRCLGEWYFVWPAWVCIHQLHAHVTWKRDFNSTVLFPRVSNRLEPNC